MFCQVIVYIDLIYYQTNIYIRVNNDKKTLQF